ncbi:hypothetical protein C1H46_006762 [Malus baccata]|uniref:Uncharacterized protein n=1 Tax=Malus baccata TaxID=106549 RepID=A0A540N9B8_MALBA|nr:hypothetical protein C1H46_006762 [Malus baccata]
MGEIFHLFENQLVEETSSVDWNSPPIYDKYIDDDEEVNENFVDWSSTPIFDEKNDYYKYLILVANQECCRQLEVTCSPYWDSAPIFVECHVDVGKSSWVEQRCGQLTKNVKPLAFCFHDYIWDEFINRALVKRKCLDKELPFAHYWSFLFSFMSIYGLLEAISLEAYMHHNSFGRKRGPVYTQWKQKIYYELCALCNVVRIVIILLKSLLWEALVGHPKD